MSERKTPCETRRSERKTLCEPRVRKSNTVQATEGMEKIAENAMIKKAATSYCDGEEGRMDE